MLTRDSRSADANLAVWERFSVIVVLWLQPSVGAMTRCCYGSDLLGAMSWNSDRDCQKDYVLASMSVSANRRVKKKH